MQPHAIRCRHRRTTRRDGSRCSVRSTDCRQERALLDDRRIDSHQCRLRPPLLNPQQLSGIVSTAVCHHFPNTLTCVLQHLNCCPASQRRQPHCQHDRQESLMDGSLHRFEFHTERTISTHHPEPGTSTQPHEPAARLTNNPQRPHCHYDPYPSNGRIQQFPALIDSVASTTVGHPDHRISE